MPRSTRVASPVSEAQFQQEAVRRITELRTHFDDLIRRLPAQIGNASDLQRVTELDMKLCWKIFRVISASDSLAAAQYVPGAANMRSFALAMRTMGAPEQLVARITEASDEFERFVAEHAGDRHTFDSMVSGFAGADNEKKATMRHRRAAFKANSHIWGVQAEALAMAMIQRPSARNPEKLDEIGLRGEYGVRRLRPTPAPLYEQGFAIRDKHGREFTSGHRKSLSGDEEGVGLIPEFSTRPLPRVAVRQSADGQSNAVVMHTELGIKAALDLVMGFELCNVSPRFKGDETHSWAIARVTKPFRTVIVDLILEEGTLPHPPRPFGFMSSKNTLMALPEELWTTAQLSDGEMVRYLGRGPATLRTAEIPRYHELVEWAIRRAGWDPDRFETWRLRVDYPVTLSSVGLVYEMPSAPRG